jgi:hypothetical protein
MFLVPFDLARHTIRFYALQALDSEAAINELPFPSPQDRESGQKQRPPLNLCEKIMNERNVL